MAQDYDGKMEESSVTSKILGFRTLFWEAPAGLFIPALSKRNEEAVHIQSKSVQILGFYEVFQLHPIHTFGIQSTTLSGGNIISHLNGEA